MPFGRSGHDVWRGPGLVAAKRWPFYLGAAELTGADHRDIASGVPRYDKFLLAGLLVVVTGWIIFRLVVLVISPS